MRRTCWLFCIASALLIELVGCSPTIRRPRLLHPGPAGYQRYNAEQFDPYPAVDVGPEIDGGRPIDYMRPRNEVEDARRQLPVGPWRMAPRY